MELNVFSRSFDKTLRYHRITGKALHERTGVSENHISEFRKGGNVSAAIMAKLLEGMEELAPGSKLHFCLLLAGEDPKQSTYSRPSLQSLFLSASPKEKAEVLNLMADWLESRDSTETKPIPEAV